MIPLPPEASAGLFGKLPARGDFVRENLPRDFTDAWDAWWQRGLADTQARWPDAWRDAWLETPIWRFMLPPGVCGKSGMLGLWIPSVDKVGRYSPLTIAAAAPCDWLPYVGVMAPFLAAAEAAACNALEHDLAPVEVMERIQPALVSADTPDPDPGFVDGHTAWWTEGGPRVRARFETGVGLPEGNWFAAFMDDEWGGSDGGLPSAPGTQDAS
ncbi:type VI secretion system-associated protein TagF [Reyranella sp.]|uniref:type VI secretion system-associated protein TagF n=1 Tax=Reyranella sp. TaxID=1929291 RepID=UPI003D0B1B7F